MFRKVLFFALIFAYSVPSDGQKRVDEQGIYHN